MMNIEKGRYWDLPWSLVSGCTPCSPGCDRCWSLGIERRFKHGDGTVTIHPERLSIPLKRRKSTVYAVWNDFFHEAVPVRFMIEALTIMAQRPDHTYLLLTKRPQEIGRLIGKCGSFPEGVWPNLWNGLTICNQEEADEKIPIFLQIPGKKYLSIEPMLGPINFRWQLYRQYLERTGSIEDIEPLKSIDAVIIGGETGSGARPMHPDWLRSLRDQCSAAGVPFFFKSWGSHLPGLTDILPSGAGAPCYVAFDLQYQMRRIDGLTHDVLPWNK